MNPKNLEVAMSEYRRLRAAGVSPEVARSLARSRAALAETLATVARVSK